MAANENAPTQPKCQLVSYKVIDHKTNILKNCWNKGWHKVIQRASAGTRHRDFKGGTRRKRGGQGEKIDKRRRKGGQDETYAEKGPIEEVFTNAGGGQNHGSKIETLKVYKIT